MDLKKTIRKYALQNAVRFKGKASPGAIIGKVFAEAPELKEKASEISKMISETVKEVNSMGVDAQKKELESLAPELLEKKSAKKKDIFEFLKISGKVHTAFPPEPSKYPHIGHAKAILLNYELAKKYKGKFTLRFEDTNPALAKKEFYDIHLDNYKWLGIKPDNVDYASDHMEEFYKYAESLLKRGDAYLCTCDHETLRKNRFKGLECACRNKKAAWQDFEKMGEGQGVLRLKIDMKHKNTTMRDPAIMRIIDAEHARKGSKYRIWPTYDFENAVMDGIEGITHRLRSKEFEMRNELQRHIQRILGFKETKIYEFARFNLEGVESSGRVIREKIEKGELLGWDDPSLTTLVALRRRGFLPEAIKNFVISTGITKAEATLTWDDLIVHNKRLLDSSSNRYFFVCNPKKIIINGAPEKEVSLKLHPDYPKRGFRKLRTNERFYIANEDYESLRDGKLYRLMGCLNFRKEKESFVFDSVELENYKRKGERIMHWLPADEALVNVEVLMPDKTIASGFAEPLVNKIKVGEVIQFERFGFARLDEKKKDKLIFWFTNK
ncbi:glutamate--tRNA ligase [Candidatus Woesearchaeota archaeon]|nr:MAG: glutamate--tRNA ligase [Candidatus Woesearchaeota archaeon]